MQLVPHPLALWMMWLNICSLGLFCCRDWCVCDFPKPCCCDVFQTSQMHLSTWYCLNTRAKVWNWNGSQGTITTAQPQVKGASVCAGVSTYSIALPESHSDWYEYDIHTFLGIILHVNRFVWYQLVQYESIIDSSKHELRLVSLRNIQAQSRVWGVFCTAGG